MLRNLRFLFAIVLLVLTVAGVQAQVTTASMSGRVADTANEPIIGATVQAIHMPSGTQYGAITNMDGRYTIQGMRTGGPYKLSISYVGYQGVVYEDITLQLGEVYNLNVEMNESSELLNEVVVTAAKTKFAAEKREPLPTFPLHRSRISLLLTEASVTLPVSRLMQTEWALPVGMDVQRTLPLTVPTLTITLV